MKKTELRVRILEIRETSNYSLSIKRHYNSQIIGEFEKDFNNIHIIVKPLLEDMAFKRFRITIPINLFDAYTLIKDDIILITLCENWRDITNTVLDSVVIKNIELI